MWYCMQVKRECQKVLIRGQGIFKKFWPRGGGEGYFADDERAWGVTPSLMYSVSLCCVVLCLYVLLQGLSYEHAKKYSKILYLFKK